MTCPVWPGHPVMANWVVPDPAAVAGSKALRLLAFRQAFGMLERRIRLFLDIRFELGRRHIEQVTDQIGHIDDANYHATISPDGAR